MRAPAIPSAAATLAAFVLLPVAAPAAEPPVPAELPEIKVKAQAEDEGYAATETRSATKTDTPLRDVPQAATVVNRRQIQDQAMQSLNDVARYVPGVGTAQGEGNRETLILRGINTTSDYFVDGIRDDVQYYRDLYNIDRVEVLRGPNAMIFGRGGTGGVVNRVLRKADWQRVREAGVQAGSYESYRASFDIGEGFNSNVAGRLMGVYEDSQSYRDHVYLERQGINPSLALRTGADTVVNVGLEYFLDERTADRGIPSQNGRPFATGENVFFGNPELSHSDAEAGILTAVVEHQLGETVSLRNSSRYASYNKFYSNVFANGPVDADGNVPLAAYNNATQRDNVFNQTDLVWKATTGPIRHTLLGGLEIGRQVTDNLRLTGFFADGPNVTNAANSSTYLAPASAPTIFEPLTFRPRPNGSDGNNDGRARILGVYAQDQVEFIPQLQAVIGARFDHFEVDFLNRNNGTQVENTDDEVSPRLGLIYKPAEPVSIYASWTQAFQPRAGEQLASLSPSNAAFEPEEFVNHEVGAKWDVMPALALTAAVYRLDRNNVVVQDPADATVTFLADGQRTEGLELGVSGNVTPAWSIAGGYAWQEAELTRYQTAALREGARLAQVPEHSASLWNRYDFTPSWGAGVGVLYRDDMFAAIEDVATPAANVTLEGYTRVDAALFYTFGTRLRAQLNVENLLDEDYYVNAHNNNNILPGAPLNVRASVVADF